MNVWKKMCVLLSMMIIGVLVSGASELSFVWGQDSGGECGTEEEGNLNLLTIYAPGEDSAPVPHEKEEEPGPAKAELPMLFFSDANDDGYADILVWKRRYTSRRRREKKEGSFILNAEELHVMYFESEEMTFSAITRLESQPEKYLGNVLFAFQ